MDITRLRLRKSMQVFLTVMLIISPFARSGHTQSRPETRLQPDVRRALALRTSESVKGARKDGYASKRSRAALPSRPARLKTGDEVASGNMTRRRPARLIRNKAATSETRQQKQQAAEAFSYPPILAGTRLSWILHTSQLSLTSSSGTNEQYLDFSGDLVADERTTFDASGGSFDIAVGPSGARYEVFSATLENRRVGALVVGFDSNRGFRPRLFEHV